MKPPVTLITGFGPFPGVEDNPSAMIARRLALEGHEAHVLPTEYNAGLFAFDEMLARIDPDIILCFGVAVHSDRIRLERTARNAMRTDKTDAAGVCYAAELIDPDGPETLPSSLPLHKIAAALTAAHMPFQISDDAGGYLCNYLFYQLMSELIREMRSGKRARQGGFVHVPTLEVSGYSADKLLRAARIVLGACVEDEAVSQGTTVIARQV